MKEIDFGPFVNLILPAIPNEPSNNIEEEHLSSVGSELKISLTSKSSVAFWSMITSFISRINTQLGPNRYIRCGS
jgi:hypothetical protein